MDEIFSQPGSLSWIKLQLLLMSIGFVIMKEKTVLDTRVRFTSSGHEILHGLSLERTGGGKYSRRRVVVYLDTGDAELHSMTQCRLQRSGSEPPRRCV